MRWLDGIIDSMDMSLEQTLGESEGQGSLEPCNPWDHKESDMTKRLNNNKLANCCKTVANFCNNKPLQENSGSW